MWFYHGMSFATTDQPFKFTSRFQLPFFYCIGPDRICIVCVWFAVVTVRLDLEAYLY
jgi:hypothetical protein